MGRIFAVEFEQANTEYYMCKQCRTHIAKEEDFICIHLDTELGGGVFNTAVNVRVDEPVHHRQVGANTVADIYCVRCGDKLGWKYIQVDGEQITLQNENVKLNMKKLLKKHGNQVLDAETMNQVPENP